MRSARGRGCGRDGEGLATLPCGARSREGFIAHIAWHEWGHALKSFAAHRRTSQTASDFWPWLRLASEKASGVRDTLQAAIPTS